jgi:hypothetical protein
LIALPAFAPGLSAQADDQARRITSRPEYKGYRVERPPGRAPGDGAADGGSDGGSGSADGGTGEDVGTRRGAGAGGPSRGSGGPSGGGSGGSSGGMAAPAWIGSLFTAIAWIILAVGVAVALFFIVKALLGIKFKGRKKSDKSKRKKTTAEPGQAAVEAEEAITLDEKVFEDALEVALREYREAVAREDFAAATLLAYRIFWLRAGWRGCVEQADVRTWRDALRMVRAAEVRQDVRALLPMVERVRYAEYKPAKHEFNTWTLSLEKIEPAGVLQ